MPLTITRRDLDSLAHRARDAQSRVARMRAKGESVTGQLSQTLEIAAGAAANGFISGRYGQINIGPVPADLAAAVALHLGGFAGVAGKYDEHLHNFADGLLAGYITKFMVGLGTSARAKAGLPAVSTSGENARMHGGMPAMNAGYAPLSEAELAAMAHQIR